MNGSKELKNTKNIIESKFKELVYKKPFSKVTVSEIIGECKINRKTFYYYFDDIFALLKYSLRKDAIQIAANYDFADDFAKAMCFVIDYIEKNNAYLKNIYSSVGRDELKRFFYNDFKSIATSIFGNDRLADDEETRAFFIKFYTEGVASTLVDLIVDYPDINKEKTIKHLILITEKLKS